MILHSRVAYLQKSTMNANANVSQLCCKQCYFPCTSILASQSQVLLATDRKFSHALIVNNTVLYRKCGFYQYD